MVAVDDDLARFVSEVGRGEIKLFMASCVERGSGAFFLALSGVEARGDDVDKFLLMLEDLWRISSVPESDIRLHYDRISKFAESQGDEEPDGVMAYAYDAISSMSYAYEFLVTGDLSNVAFCSNHMINSASFLDDALGSGQAFLEEEVNAQLSDMDLLCDRKLSAELHVSTLRDSARDVGLRRVEVLKTIFP